jgi:hypothetical protein
MQKEGSSDASNCQDSVHWKGGLSRPEGVNKYSLYLEIYMNYATFDERGQGWTSITRSPVDENIPTLSLRRVCKGGGIDDGQDEG